MDLLAGLIRLYELVIIVQVITTWLVTDRSAPFYRTLDQLVEPVLAPVRRILPKTGSLDLSPLVVLLALELLRSFLI